MIVNAVARIIDHTEIVVPIMRVLIGVEVLEARSVEDHNLLLLLHTIDADVADEYGWLVVIAEKVVVEQF